MNYRFVSLSEAIELVASKIKLPLGIEAVSVFECVGRASARDYVAPTDIPLVNASAVDGYAVRSVDTFGASSSSPVELSLGSECSEGTAVRVLTGDPIPPSCDAVVRDEDVELRDGKVLVYRAVPSYHNVRRAGEDLRSGELIVKKGQVLRPWHAAALAACGFHRVEVLEKVRVGIVVVGSEVVEPSEGIEAYRKGLVLNSTGPLVVSALRELDPFEPRYLGIVRDDPKEIARAIEEALAANHVVVTTGGTGPSPRDVTTRAIEMVGGEIVVRGIAIRPGRPTSAAIVDGKPVFMLSGFPVAAFLALKYFAIPSLARALGIELTVTRCIAKLVSRLPSTSSYTCFSRARVWIEGNELLAQPLAIKGSGNVSTLIKGNALIVVPEGVEGFEEGDQVLVDLL